MISPAGLYPACSSSGRTFSRSRGCSNGPRIRASFLVFAWLDQRRWRPSNVLHRNGEKKAKQWTESSALDPRNSAGQEHEPSGRHCRKKPRAPSTGRILENILELSRTTIHPRSGGNTRKKVKQQYCVFFSSFKKAVRGTRYPEQKEFEFYLHFILCRVAMFPFAFHNN